jgi:hypothetical protein
MFLRQLTLNLVVRAWKSQLSAATVERRQLAPLVPLGRLRRRSLRSIYGRQ